MSSDTPEAGGAPQAVNESVIDGNCRSKRAVMARLARDLRFPSHFGHNLDALFDVLTTDVRGPVRIVWRNTDSARRHLGEDFDAIRSVLEDVARERDDVRLEIEP